MKGALLRRVNFQATHAEEPSQRISPARATIARSLRRLDFSMRCSIWSGTAIAAEAETPMRIKRLSRGSRSVFSSGPALRRLSVTL